MGERQFALGNTPIVRLEDLQAVRLGGTVTRAYPDKRVAEIPSAPLAVVFGLPQVQGQDLVALAGMLDVPLVGRFDPQIRPLAHLNTLCAHYTFNLKAR